MHFNDDSKWVIILSNSLFAFIRRQNAQIFIHQRHSRQPTTTTVNLSVVSCEKFYDDVNFGRHLFLPPLSAAAGVGFAPNNGDLCTQSGANNFYGDITVPGSLSVDGTLTPKDGVLHTRSESSCLLVSQMR
jgi:hypothetical protein